MVPHTRRDTLLAAGAGLAALAGCAGTSTRESEQVGPEPPENAVTDPDRYRLRSSAVNPLVTLEGEESAGPRDVFTDAERAASLSFADVDGAAEARAFVRATDFDAETLFVDRGTVRACFERRLCYVTWSEGDATVSYGRVHRPWDTPCGTDDRDFCCWLIRVPAALEDVSNYARGLSSGACRLPPHIREAADAGGTNATHDTEGGR